MQRLSLGSIRGLKMLKDYLLLFKVKMHTLSSILEGDALNVVLTIQQPHLFEGWNFSNVVSDISLYLHSFFGWKADKVSRSANFRAHYLAKLATSHLVFGSIPIGLSILSSIRNRSEKLRSSLVTFFPFQFRKKKI
jgi:hypothetical protein